MTKFQSFLATLPALLFIALKVGVVIGGTGSALEAIGLWRNWPKLVAVGKKLEAIGTDIPKLVARVNGWLPPSGPKTILDPYTPVRSQAGFPPDPPPSSPDAAAMIGLRILLTLCALVAMSCSPAAVAAEKKANAEAMAKINQYCDAREKALEGLQSPDGGEAGARP